MQSRSKQLVQRLRGLVEIVGTVLGIAFGGPEVGVAQHTGNLAEWHACGSEQGGARVSEIDRRHTFETRLLGRCPERRAHRLHRLAVKLDHIPALTLTHRPGQLRPQRPGNRHYRPQLDRPGLPRGMEVNPGTHEIDLLNAE